MNVLAAHSRAPWTCAEIAWDVIDTAGTGYRAENGLHHVPDPSGHSLSHLHKPPCVADNYLSWSSSSLAFIHLFAASHSRPRKGKKARFSKQELHQRSRCCTDNRRAPAKDVKWILPVSEPSVSMILLSRQRMPDDWQVA